DQRFPSQDIRSGIQKDAFRFQAVAPRPAGLLLVVLDRFRHRGVDHSANIAAINAHPERDCGYNDVDLLVSESILSFAALLRVHTCVIERGAHSAIPKGFGKILGIFPADAIDDCCLSFMPAEYFEDLIVQVETLKHAIYQVGSIEHADELCRITKPELL